MTAPHTQDRQTFFSLLHRPSEHSQIELRLLAESEQPLRDFFSSPDEAIAFIEKHGEGRNVYAGMATRRDGQGDAAHLSTLRTLWLDFDFDTENFEGDLEALRMALEDFPYPPSMSVRSGGGVHLYWFLEKPLLLHSEEAKRLLHCVERGMADVLGADANAVDPARIMRVPGTINWPNGKKRSLGRKKAPCVIERLDADLLYDFTDFEDLFELRGASLLQQAEPKRYDQTPFDGVFPPNVERLLAKMPAKLSAKAQASWDLLSTRWNGSADGLGDTSESSIDLAIANLLVLFDIPAHEVEHALRFRREDQGLGHKHAGYFKATVENACGWNEARKDERAEVSQQRVDALALATVQETFPVVESPLEDNTEDGLALRFLREERDSYRYCAENHQWYAHDGLRWALDETQKTVHAARTVIQSLYRDLADEPDEKERAKLEKMAKASRRWNVMKSVVSIAGTDPHFAVRVEQFDTRKNCVNVKNGVLNLDTGVLEARDRSELLTRVVPVEYNPHAECPLWEKFLRETQPDEEMRKFLQRAIGYSITGDTSEECVFINQGGGANGKSTAMETIAHILGDYSMALPPTTLLVEKFDSIPNDLAKLPSVRFCTVMETDEGKRLSEARIKSLASGERMPARHLYKGWFEFEPDAKFWLTSNHKPEVKGTDDGIWRRLRLIPWKVRFEGEDRDLALKEKLRAEAEGIFAWIVRGHSMWKATGLAEPRQVVLATAEYRGEEDIIGAFLEECCVLGAQRLVPNRRLRPAYENWCKENGHQPASNTKLGRSLEARGFRSERRGGLGRVRIGLDVPEDPTPF